MFDSSPRGLIHKVSGIIEDNGKKISGEFDSCLYPKDKIRKNPERTLEGINSSAGYKSEKIGCFHQKVVGEKDFKVKMSIEVSTS